MRAGPALRVRCLPHRTIHISYIPVLMMLHVGAARLLSRMIEQAVFITGCMAI